MPAAPSSNQRVRVAFMSSASTRLDFAIELDFSRATENGIARSLISGTLYEQFTSWVAIGLLRPGDVAIDVGAHVGYYTLLFRALVGEAGKVFAYEPQAESHRKLLHNIAINGYANIEATRAALGEHAGESTLYVNLDNEGESALWDVSKSSRFPRSARQPTQQKVRIDTLDSKFTALDVPVRLMKIDAEGAEMLILRGGQEWFRISPPQAVICEVNRGALAQCGSSESGLRDFFERFGYTACLVNVTQGGPYDLCQGAIARPFQKHEVVDTKVIFNLLFLQPGTVPAGIGL